MFSDLEVFVYLLACLCHDCNHQGTNNSFENQTKTKISY